MAIRPSTISRFRASTRFMSVAVEPVTMPKRSAWRTRSATFALQISFLLGRQLVFGQEPPINLRSTTAERCPDLAMCQERYLPPSPLPRTSISKCSGWDIVNSSLFESERLIRRSKWFAERGFQLKTRRIKRTNLCAAAGGCLANSPGPSIRRWARGAGPLALIDPPAAGFLLSPKTILRDPPFGGLAVLAPCVNIRISDRDQSRRRDSGRTNSEENRDGDSNHSVETRRQRAKATACAEQRLLHDHGRLDRRGTDACEAGARLHGDQRCASHQPVLGRRCLSIRTAASVQGAEYRRAWP